MLGFQNLCNAPRPLGLVTRYLRHNGAGDGYKLRLLSHGIRDVVDPDLFRTIRIRSTSSSMLGISSILTKNPRLCNLIEGVEYHLTPNAATPEVRAEAQEFPPTPYHGDYGGFSGAMDLVRKFLDHEEAGELSEHIGNLLEKQDQGHGRTSDYDDLLRCEKGRPEDSEEIIIENFRFSENTFYDRGLDFLYFARIC